MNRLDERPIRLRASHTDFLSDQIEIRAVVRADGEHQAARALPLTFKTYEPAERGMPIAPALCLTQTEAQELMDELWRVGLRPTEGTGSAGALAATQRHLEDMRALIFKKAGVQAP